MKYATFIDVKNNLLKAVRDNRDISLAIKGGIYGSWSVFELVRQVNQFKKQFPIPFPTRVCTRQPLVKLRALDQSSPPNKTLLPNPAGSQICYKCGKAKISQKSAVVEGKLFTYKKKRRFHPNLRNISQKVT